MALLAAAVEVARTGVTLTGAAVAASDTFANTGRELLVVTNGDASSKTVTIDYKLTADGQTVTDRVVTVPAGETWVIGPFPPSMYNDAGGLVTVTYSATTSVTAKVIRIGALG